MEHLPKIVQARLQATAKAGVHPDPDLLTAFAEKSLGEQERGQMLEHLSHCADCREVLALAGIEASPAEVEEPEMVLAATPRMVAAPRGWLRMPALRWASLAACVVVVGATALLLRERKAASTATYVTSKAADVQVSQAQPPAEELKAMSADKVSAAAEKEVKKQATQQDALAKSSMPVPLRAVRRPVTVRDESELDTRRQKAANELAAAAPAAPSPAPAPATAQVLPRNTNETVSVSVEQATVAQPAKDGAVGEIAKSEPAAASGGLQATAGPVAAKAKPLRDPFFMGMRRANGPGSGFAGISSSSVNWAVSPEGRLQRSTDAGKTWEAVPMLEGSSFHAVSAVGRDVWAGGDHGLLCHSSDGGGHWTEVKPVFLGTALTADIVHIEFLDARHGRLTTANQEIWATTDGGATWLKR